MYARRPSGDYSATFSGSYGRFNALDFEGAVEAPIVEGIVSSRFAFRLVDRDGFAKNDCGNAPAFEDRGVRTEAGSNPTDAVVAEAEKRTREIRGAYEMLKARRSIR